MSAHSFFWVDAFTERAYAGNPCAVLLDTDDLSAERMQTIAREMNLSETSFVRRSSVAGFAARYFTPAEEIPLAGHPTIATTWALIEAGRLRSPVNETYTYALELKEGPVDVSIDASAGSRPMITMTQRRPEFGRTYDAADVLPAFGLTAGDALPDVPIQMVSTGTPQLMVPLRDRETLKRAVLDVERYRKLKADADFFSPHCFCLGGFTSVGNTSARHFGVPPDTMEDPFTGSATGGMAAYLWHYSLIQEPSFVAEQGHPMGRPGTAWVQVAGPRDDIAAVRVGGTAVTIARGELED